MRTPARILVADDSPDNREILKARLQAQNYEIVTANDGEEALSLAGTCEPDLILLDVMMPKMDGLEVCRRLKSDTSLPFIPIIIISAKTDPADIVAGLEAGADEYLTKPTNQTALVARVRSMLRVKELHDKTVKQAGELANWNQTLEQRVEQQRAQLEQAAQLKQFLSPQLSNTILSTGNEALRESHRQNITVLFGDLRNFTEFSAMAEPEEEMQILRDYLKVMGALIARYEATLDHLAGDGVMAFFNDPLPCPNPASQAVRMAISMRDEVGQLIERWRKQGLDLGFGIGIANGFATIGQVELEGFYQYTAIGSVCNLAARLCDRAGSGQILVTQKLHAEIDDFANMEPVGNFELKGFYKPVRVFDVVSLT